jgi:COP9 signalosome complex subunit 1
LLALGKYYSAHGEYSNAIGKFLECKEFILPTSIDEQLDLHLHIINTSIESGTLSHVRNQVQRAKSLIDSNVHNSVIESQLNVAQALYWLKSKNYYHAAESFLAVTSDLASTYANVATCRDIAVYGVLTALASYDRKQLRTQLLNNTEFAKLLDSAPEFRSLLQAFSLNQYNTVFKELESMKPLLQLDMWIGQHMNQLIRQTRDTALLNHVKPYSSVSIQATGER